MTSAKWLYALISDKTRIRVIASHAAGFGAEFLPVHDEGDGVGMLQLRHDCQTINLPAWDGTARKMGEVWTLRKGNRVASCHVWTHPKGDEVRLTVDGDWHRGEALRGGLALLDVALEWRNSLRRKVAVKLSPNLFPIASLIAGTVLLGYANVLADRMRDEINRAQPGRPISRRDALFDVLGTLQIHQKLFPESRLRTMGLLVAVGGYACFVFVFFARALR